MKILVLFLCLQFSAQAATVIYDEAVNGDLSTDQDAPSLFTVDQGSNTIAGRVYDSIDGTRDIDFFTLSVPEGLVISQLNILEYSFNPTPSKPTNLSYLLLAPGSVLPARISALSNGTSGIDINNLAIGTSFVTNPPTTNPLVFLLNNGGLFAPGQQTLPAGNYAFWMNETSVASGYKLEFVVQAVPEPSGCLLAVGSLVLVFRRKR